MTIIPYGPDCFLFRFAAKPGAEAFAKGQAIVACLQEHPLPDLLEYVPALTTVLLEFRPGAVSGGFPLEWLDRLAGAADKRVAPGPLKEIGVIYDGPDLERVARWNRMTVDEVRQRHIAPIYHVYMLGFSPGFPYLGELDPRLHTPRLPQPRLRVAAGSVGIGGEHTGIYSIASPGGWNIIGRTEVELFSPDRPVAPGQESALFLLHPGDRVKFLPL